MIKRLWKKWIHQYCKRYWYLNVIHFPVNFYKFMKEIFSFLKNGYPYEAVYNLDDYFVDLYLKIFEDYKANKNGYPSKYEREEDWDEVLQEMIDCLKALKEADDNYNVEYLTTKRKFFKLFSTNFNDLWD